MELEDITGIIGWMWENYSNPDLTFTQIAEKSGYGQYYFSREFRKATGVSVMEFLGAVRIAKAQEILQTRPLMDMGMVAFHTGSRGSAVFSTRFKRLAGVAPVFFRELSQSHVIPPVVWDRDSVHPPTVRVRLYQCPECETRECWDVDGPNATEEGSPAQCISGHQFYGRRVEV